MQYLAGSAKFSASLARQNLCHTHTQPLLECVIIVMTIVNGPAGAQIAKLTPFRSYVVTLMTALSLTIMSLLKFKAGTITYVVVSLSAPAIIIIIIIIIITTTTTITMLSSSCCDQSLSSCLQLYWQVVLDATWPDVSVFLITSLLQHVHTFNIDKPAATLG